MDQYRLGALEQNGMAPGRRFGDERALLAAGPFDLVLIGSPNHVHSEQLKLALDQASPVFVEKPIVRTEAESYALAERLNAPPDAEDADGRAFQLRARSGHDVWDRLEAITCPTFVGYGRHDGIAPEANSTAIASRIPGAELRGYDGGHLFVFQDPAAFPDLVAFLHGPAN